MIEIDGSFGEGGGAILRVATALSAITNKSCKVFNIRKGRTQPGLKAQHLESLITLSRLTNAKLTGDGLGSTEIEFYPGNIESKEIEAVIKTAGSPGLLFQNIKIPASMGEKETIIKVKGGAIAGLGAPPIPYLQNITFPILRRFGYRANADIKKYGFFPSGGAEVEFKIAPWKERTALILEEQGSIEKIEGISIASKHLEKAKVADRQAESAKNILTKLPIESNIEVKYIGTDCPGSVIILWARTDAGAILGSDALGERRVRSEDVGKKAANDLIRELETKAAVDWHMSDQLLIFMSLLNQKSSFTTSTLTNHAKTNMWVIKHFLDVDFKIEHKTNHVLIKCPGLE